MDAERIGKRWEEIVASRQLKRAIEKHRNKAEAVERYCEICKKKTTNCAHREDDRGKSLFCLCPSCLVSSMDERAIRARKLLNG